MEEGKVEEERRVAVEIQEGSQCVLGELMGRARVIRTELRSLMQTHPLSRRTGTTRILVTLVLDQRRQGHVRECS